MAESITLARPYAKAAFDYARDQKALAEWSTQLNLAAAVAGNDKMVKIIASPSYTTEQQAQALLDLCGNELAEKPSNFIRTLATNKRLPLLPEIAELFDLFKANQENSVNVEIATAFTLGDELTSKLTQALRTSLQREVSVSEVIDKSLLGGVIVRSGDVVIDGSVRGRLQKLAKAMNA